MNPAPSTAVPIRRLNLDDEWVASTERDLAEIRAELAIEEQEGADDTDGADAGKKP